MERYPPGFEEDHHLRSAFIRDLALVHGDISAQPSATGLTPSAPIPKVIIRYWHDPGALPDDVRACLNSWDRLGEEGFKFRLFSDVTAAEYISERYTSRELEAFARCRHPAMRSDYLRLCFVLAEGGLYVDADDVLLGEGWKYIFRDGRLKVQPLCYDCETSRMVPTADIWRANSPMTGRIYYVNNDPIAAPPEHPILRRALTQATDKLLARDWVPEIQSTTGPGNFTAALAAHARDLKISNAPLDFELISDWEAIAETRWELSYRGDDRNWRNMDTGFGHE
jgi:mannosyltransferase OCH1-like enzyme